MGASPCTYPLMSYSVTPVGFMRSCFKEKFAIPRQPLLAPAARGVLELVPPFDRAVAVEGLERISWAEAARWLVHVHAFDPSGIRSGAVGDPSVKGGKGYPIGPGWTGQVGVVIVEGQKDPNGPGLLHRTEIWRYEADTPPDQGVPIAEFEDRLGRFLTPADLDGDGRQELYVANDNGKTLRRFVWNGRRLVKEDIYTRQDDRSILTWNIMAIPVGLVPE